MLFDVHDVTDAFKTKYYNIIVYSIVISMIIRIDRCKMKRGEKKVQHKSNQSNADEEFRVREESESESSNNNNNNKKNEKNSGNA